MGLEIDNTTMMLGCLIYVLARGLSSIRAVNNLKGDFLTQLWLQTQTLPSMEGSLTQNFINIEHVPVSGSLYNLFYVFFFRNSQVWGG